MSWDSVIEIISKFLESLNSRASHCWSWEIYVWCQHITQTSKTSSSIQIFFREKPCSIKVSKLSQVTRWVRLTCTNWGFGLLENGFNIWKMSCFTSIKVIFCFWSQPKTCCSDFILNIHHYCFDEILNIIWKTNHNCCCWIDVFPRACSVNVFSKNLVWS